MYFIQYDMLFHIDDKIINKTLVIAFQKMAQSTSLESKEEFCALLSVATPSHK